MTRILRLSAAILGVLAFQGGQSYAADKLPFKLFDTHAHFVSDDFDQYPLSSQSPGAPAGGQQQAAPGGQQQAPPGGQQAAPGGQQQAGPRGQQQGAPAGGGQQGASGMQSRFSKGNTTTAEKMFSWWDANGVEAGVGVQYRSAYGTNNSYLLDVADKNPSRVAPVVILDASDPKTPDQLRSLAKAHGVSGIRLTGSGDTTQWLDSDAAQNTWAAANELGLAVVLMSTPPGAAKAGEVIPASALVLEHVAQLADKYPNVKIVLDHCGWPDQEGAPNYGLTAAHLALKAHRNVYYKFTTINLDRLSEAKLSAPDYLRHLVDVYGADHIMWGSDMGNSKGTYDEMVTRALAAITKLNASEQKQMMSDTGRSVFIRGGRAAAATANPGRATAPPAGAANPGAAPAATAAAAAAANNNPCGEAVVGASIPQAPAGLELSYALKLAQAALDICGKQGYKVGVTVVDSVGGAKVTLVADGSGVRPSTTVRKACTAAYFQMPTSELETKIKTDSALAAKVAAGAGFVAHTGAIPLMSGSKVIGGIGVSGAPSHENDDDCARKAIEALKSEMH
jgi:L-fuconolactonase